MRLSKAVDVMPALRLTRKNGMQKRGATLNMMTVLDALSSPMVLTAGAIGTLDGFGRIAINIPRYMPKLLSQKDLGDDAGNKVSLSELREYVVEDYGAKLDLIKLFVSCDVQGTGVISSASVHKLFDEQERGTFRIGSKWVTADNILELTGLDRMTSINYIKFMGTIVEAADLEDMRVKAQAKLVSDGYEACKDMTSEYAKTFYLATQTMPDEQAMATWAIYAWCRRVDEIVDGPNALAEASMQEESLREWMDRLERMWEGKNFNGLNQYDVAFADMIRRFPGSDIEPYKDMVRGMMMDVSDEVKYDSWEQLYLYCYRVASTVGLMTLPVMGTAEGVTQEDARESAIALGIALQLTNILRDVGEDARDRGRIYLPEEDMKRFGVDPQTVLDRSLKGGEVDDAYRNLMKFEIERAREYYRQAEKGIPMLAKSAQLPVAVAMELYREILDKIELNDYDNFSRRAYLTGFEKLCKLPGVWLRVITGSWNVA